jgi:hypothetical protein
LQNERENKQMQMQRLEKKRKVEAMDSALPIPWPAKAIPSLDPTLQPFSWPYGPDALIEERDIVGRIVQTSHLIRMPSLKWPGYTAYYSHEGIGLLGMRMSCDDSFVDSSSKRNMLVDRVHHYFNSEWKLEVLALTGSATDAQNPAARDSLRFVHYGLTEDHLYDVVNKIDRLQSLYYSLKPETIDLIRRCHCTADIKRSMVAPTDPSSFLAAPAWQ